MGTGKGNRMWAFPKWTFKDVDQFLTIAIGIAFVFYILFLMLSRTPSLPIPTNNPMFNREWQGERSSLRFSEREDLPSPLAPSESEGRERPSSMPSSQVGPEITV